MSVSPFQALTLAALNLRLESIYAGTASPHKVAKRRARNKVARRQRRINRQRG